MRLNSDTPVPDNVTATVKSVSAIGEQYIDLVPPDDAPRPRRRCATDRRSARTAPRSGRTSPNCSSRPTSWSSSLGNSRLQDLLREAFKAFNGSGPELARLIQSARLLVDEANANCWADHAADRPGRPVPGRPDPQRRRHQVAGRRSGPVHHRGAPTPTRSCATAAADRARGRRRGQHHVRRHPAVLPDAGGQPGQLRPDRRDLPQVASSRRW